MKPYRVWLSASATECENRAEALAKFRDAVSKDIPASVEERHKSGHYWYVIARYPGAS